eukprot:gi/632938830/ref/XP_007906570.1/ PREDICTED: LOW QUALITY PROTEIN: synemin [Callorhinchus milii]
MFPIRSSILHEKSQLQELNSRLESYLNRVRQLEEENRWLVREIQQARSEGRTERNKACEEEIKQMRWKLKELAKEKTKTEMQRQSLWQEVMELQALCNTEQIARKGILQELSEQEKVHQIEERTNAALEEYIFQLQSEYQILEAEHEQAKLEMTEEIRRAPQTIVAQCCNVALVEQGVENYAALFSEMWGETFEMYKSKIEELEFIVQQGRGRSEDLEKEKILLVREIEALKKELRDQNDLQKRLEDDFLIVQEKQDMDVGEYQRAIELLNDEKQHLESIIDQNLKEQQQLMQMKMGLSLEVATYRALLEAEKNQQLETQDHLQKFRRGMDTTSHTFDVRPTIEWRGEKNGPIRDIPMNVRGDVMNIRKRVIPNSNPSATKTTKSLFFNADLPNVDKKLSSKVHKDMFASAVTRNAYRGSTMISPTYYDRYSTRKDHQAQHKVFPAKIERKSEVRVDKPGMQWPEYHTPVTTSQSTLEGKGNASNDANKISKSNEPTPPAPLNEMRGHDLNRKSAEPSKDENYATQSTKDMSAFRHALREEDFKTGLDDVEKLTGPRKIVCSAENGAKVEITSEYLKTDGTDKKEIMSKEESNDDQIIIIGKEGSPRDNIKIGDKIIKPTDLEKMNFEPETNVTYVEKEEILDDGTTKREITIQSTTEKVMDDSYEYSLEELLNEKEQSPEHQLKEALEHLTGTPTENVLEGLFKLGFKGRESLENISVNFEVSEEAFEYPTEADDSSMPEDSLSTEENEDKSSPLGEIIDQHEEALNVSMTAEDFRKTMLSNTEPTLQKITERSIGASSSNEYDDDDDSEDSEYLKATERDTLPKEFFTQTIIEKSIKVPQDVKTSIVELLSEGTEDPKLKLKGALEHLKEAVPKNVRDELSMLTSDDKQGSDDISVDIKNVEQSSESGVVTIVAEVNMSQSLDPEDFHLMGQYNENEANEHEMMSRLMPFDDQQQILSILRRRGLEMSEDADDESGMEIKITDTKERVTTSLDSTAPDEDDFNEEPTNLREPASKVTVHKMVVIEDMGSNLSEQSAWPQQVATKMYDEGLIQRGFDSTDSSVTFHMDMNRIMSMSGTGGEIRREELDEETDERGADNYSAKERESENRSYSEAGATADSGLRASDSEMMEHITISNSPAMGKVTGSTSFYKKIAILNLDEFQSNE